MKVTVKVRTEFRAADLRLAVWEAAKEPLMKCGMSVESSAKRSMKKGGRGKVKRGSKGRSAWRGGTPSAPPDPPNVQTGSLRAAVTTAWTSRGTVIVGPTRLAWYGKIHERGGVYGGRKYPRRAFMLPALIRMAPRFPRIVKLSLARTVAGRRLNARKGKRI